MNEIPKFRVFNATDGIYASSEEFTADDAVKFMGKFRARFKDVGYKTNQGKKIGHHAIDLQVQRVEENVC